MSQNLFYVTTALDVSGVTITHLQEHIEYLTTGKRVMLKGVLKLVCLTVCRFCIWM